MEPDYSSFLSVAEDGGIWWRLEDAIRLGAGYRPVRDDDRNSVPVLRAPTQRVRANERSLIGAFSDDRLGIPRAPILNRDGNHFVEADEFMAWLSRYLDESPEESSFPNDLARAVRRAKTLHGATKSESGEKEFVSLTLALEGRFDSPLDSLPDDLRRRVDRDFVAGWSGLSVDQRRQQALQLDYQHDPATEQERQFWWDFFQRQNGLEEDIARWESVAAPTAGELALKESRLVKLRQELAHMEQEERRGRGDYYPKAPPNDDGTPPASPSTPVRYLAYPKAMKLLADRLDASPEELAAWVWLGPKDGGIAAYRNANELDPPPRFRYDFRGDFDYLAPLMACWFREDDIARFAPVDRYLTGKTLIERWSEYPEIQVEPFIRAKILESRLLDLHPLTGGTQGGNPGNSTLPSLAKALFAESHVLALEAEDLAVGEVGATKTQTPTAEVGSAEWRRQNAATAANARHDQPGGSRDKQRQIREIWASGKYASRDLCAEQECAALDMSFAAARRALKNSPNPKK